MLNPKVYVDFQNADSQGRVRLNCVGTVEDLSKQQVELREGLLLSLYSDDLDEKGQTDELIGEGIVTFSEGEHVWVATVDWSGLRHASELPLKETPTNGRPQLTTELPTVNAGKPLG